uniref:Uncharacterized protein n=1 Tax=Candidatus Kentrum sp. TC TaxID=2126339 RepID=A0A450YWQ2_9GAMM|nr:MAG: hypothetical protein BECKTC1821D_GA0114238_10276 [Candidatus Kentron sp. TC]
MIYENIGEPKTVTDEILRELWQIKDRIAKEHNYSLDALVSYLRSKSGDTLFQNDETEPVGQVVNTLKPDSPHGVESNTLHPTEIYNRGR